MLYLIFADAFVRIFFVEKFSDENNERNTNLYLVSTYKITVLLKVETNKLNYWFNIMYSKTYVSKKFRI